MHSQRSVQLVARKHHSKPPEGGCKIFMIKKNNHLNVSTHSRAKVAAPSGETTSHRFIVSTHSRAKAAATMAYGDPMLMPVSTHSHPKVAAIPIFRLSHLHSSFQHTATRRRLLFVSRPATPVSSFNTQPCEGGCIHRQQVFVFV